MFRLIKGLWFYISGVERWTNDYGIHREEHAQRYAAGLAAGMAERRIFGPEPPARPTRRAQYPSLLSQDDASLGRANIIDFRPGRASFGAFDQRPLASIFIRPDGSRWYEPPQTFAGAA